MFEFFPGECFVLDGFGEEIFGEVFVVGAVDFVDEVFFDDHFAGDEFVGGGDGEVGVGVVSFAEDVVFDGVVVDDFEGLELVDFLRVLEDVRVLHGEGEIIIILGEWL